MTILSKYIACFWVPCFSRLLGHMTFINLIFASCNFSCFNLECFVKASGQAWGFEVKSKRAEVKWMQQYLGSYSNFQIVDLDCLDSAVVCLFVSWTVTRLFWRVGIATTDLDIVWIRLAISETFCIGEKGLFAWNQKWNWIYNPVETVRTPLCQCGIIRATKVKFKMLKREFWIIMCLVSL